MWRVREVEEKRSETGRSEVLGWPRRRSRVGGKVLEGQGVREGEVMRERELGERGGGVRRPFLGGVRSCR